MPSYGGLTWWGNFAEYGFLTRVRSEQLRDVGATMTPFNAFLFLMGLETLALRMRQHAENARRGRRVPARAPGRRVGEVQRACPTRPGTSGRCSICPKGPGAVFAFGVRGGRLPAAGSSRASAGVAPRQHRRCPHAGHPSGVDHAPAAVATRRWSPPASDPTSSASRSASRTSTTSAPTSIRRSHAVQEHA